MREMTMNNYKDRDYESTQLVLEPTALEPRETDRSECRDERPQDSRTENEHPRRHERRRDPARRDGPQRARFEPVRLFTPSAWRSSDLATLALGVVLVLGMFVAVAQGITWVILPGAAAVIFAMISTQMRWGRERRGRAQRGRARRGLGDDAAGGIVQLPARKEPSRRTG